MAKNRLFDLVETKGLFQIKGIVTGTEKDSFYKEIRTKTNKEMRIINFGIEYAKGLTLYVNLQGMEQDNVYFYKAAKKKGERGETIKVPWSNRFTYNRDGFRMIGNNIGVKKKIDETGKTVNDKKILTDFDTCKELSDNLKDGMSVFVKGEIDCSSFIDNTGVKKTSVKLVPNQVSLCADVKFDDPNYVQQNDFNQTIVFTGIDQEKENDKITGRFVVSSKIITYSNIENVDFIIENRELANKFKKALKPYDSIKVNGHIVISNPTELVTDDDDWGEADAVEKVRAQAKKEFIITGAKGSSVDHTLYTEESVLEAIKNINKANKAESDFGDNDEWGDVNLDDDSDDEPWD